MNEISCDVCMDLIPLVQDGAASEDSAAAVERHIASCPQCRTLYREHAPVEMHTNSLSVKIKNKLRTFFAFLTFLGMFFGISLLENQGIYYIVFVLPMIGACSYVIYRWKALWKSPLMLMILYFSAHMISVIQGDDFNLPGMVLWILIITVFADAGILIMGLLHIAFRKEK